MTQILTTPALSISIPKTKSVQWLKAFSIPNVSCQFPENEFLNLIFKAAKLNKRFRRKGASFNASGSPFPEPEGGSGLTRGLNFKAGKRQTIRAAMGDLAKVIS